MTIRKFLQFTRFLFVQKLDNVQQHQCILVLSIGFAEEFERNQLFTRNFVIVIERYRFDILKLNRIVRDSVDCVSVCYNVCQSLCACLYLRNIPYICFQNVPV